MAALGFPVVGDSRYEPMAGFLYGDEEIGVRQFGKEPTRIALQCSNLVFPAAIHKEYKDSEDCGRVEFRVGEPWWKTFITDHK